MVDLAALLSNSGTTTLYQRLTKRDWQQVGRLQAKRSDRARDGKLKYGTVITALLAVLAQADGPMRYIEIHREIEATLGFPVSRSSTKQLLSDEARHRRPRFERVERGLYQLIAH
jgi:hypothetical protein